MNILFRLQFIILFFIFFQVSYSQSFVDVKAGLTGVAESSCGWIDADRDGDLDILVAGQFRRSDQSSIYSRYYQNVRQDGFLSNISGLPDIYRGDFSIGDFDLDGVEDVAIIGELRGGRRIATIYRGLKNGTFRATGIQFIPVRDGSITFGDFDVDGDPDILITGESSGGPVTMVYRNERNNKFTLFNSSLPGILHGVACWIDFNLNGQLDIFITGMNSNGNAYSMLFESTAKGFSEVNTGIVALKNSNVAFGDVDNDGDPDILIIGETQGGSITTKLYLNNRRGGFRQISVPFVAVKDGFADWGDMDDDGDLDLLISGQSTNGPVSRVYRNERNGGFRDINAGIIPLYNSSGQWGDYDLDGDLDILIAGLTSNAQPIARVYRNDRYKSASRRVEITTESSTLWETITPVKERVNPIYYFVYSSSYSDVYLEGTKGYYVFVSPVKRFTKHYVLEEKFQSLLIQKFPNWPRIDQGNIIQNGFSTKEEADRSRARVIKEYEGRKFKLVEVNW
ncbi:MAG: hypothetical protein CVT92_06345 [Bacteroidetes bacterium HGW-Bacteroidetes-1]|jgi:hypothetical protein|nr:MAG: hypothetical protein CVT92_06345 [Bacteroidetes bacterium HGW-Bacteroidetes-1]